MLASTYVDYYLKKLIPFNPGHVKNSFEVIQRLKNINCSIDSISITISDAVAMYPNILNNKGISACKELILGIPDLHFINDDLN